MTKSVALAHDILGARAGGERVLLALASAFPDAPIHTLLFEPDATFADYRQTAGRIAPTWLNRSRWIRKHYRSVLPLAAPTWASRRIDADVTICSSSGLSHHVRTTGTKIVYCHTPARWLHDRDRYNQGFGTATRVVAGALRPGFGYLDRRAMREADAIAVNSHHIAAEVQAIYQRQARVIAPCSTLDLEGPVRALPQCEPGFVLSPVRPLGYKRLDVLVQAARSMPDHRFLHIGDGPHRQAAFRDVPTNLRSLGAVDDAQLRWAYRNASVVALTCAEDYGLVPLEAAAHGVATVAPDGRGMSEHRGPSITLYDEGDPCALAEAIRSAPDPSGRRDPRHLGRGRFVDEMRQFVSDVHGGSQGSGSRTPPLLSTSPAQAGSSST